MSLISTKKQKQNQTKNKPPSIYFHFKIIDTVVLAYYGHYNTKIKKIRLKLNKEKWVIFSSYTLILFYTQPTLKIITSEHPDIVKLMAYSNDTIKITSVTTLHQYIGLK